MTDVKNAVIGSYRLVRTNRRTLSISLDRDGVVTAHAPLKMPQWQIERFLAEKSGWIQQKRKVAQSRQDQALRYQVRQGGRLPYLGGEIQIELCSGKKPELSGQTLYLPNQGDPVKHALKWFRAQAETQLTPLVQQWAQRTNIHPTKLSFGHAETRWGSMNSKGEMRLNIALMHCPPAYIHYVVVHELAHRLHMNHSPAFHACVERFYPGATKIRQQGKALAGYLQLLREK